MSSSRNLHETEVRMRHCCIPTHLSSINERLTAVQRAHIESTPFKWALDISNDISISGGLLWELVSRRDSRNRGFRVRDRVVPFTSVDVCFSIGLSIVGKTLVVEEDQQCETLSLFKGAGVTVANIWKQLQKQKNRLVNFSRLYILLAFAEFYFPKTGNKVFTGFIKYLDDLDSLDTYSWGLAVYNFVVASLCESSVVLREGQNKSQRHLNGCAAVLQIWAFNHLSLGKVPAVSRLSFPRVLNWPIIRTQKKNIEKAFNNNMIIERVVATEEEMKHDIINAALFEQGQQFVDPYDYQRLVAENRDFQERITILEGEVRMLKEAKDKSWCDNEDFQDGQQIVNFITENEVGTSAGDVGHNTPPNDDANIVENQPKATSNMATRIKKKPRTKRGKNSRMNL